MRPLDLVALLAASTLVACGPNAREVSDAAVGGDGAAIVDAPLPPPPGDAPSSGCQGQAGCFTVFAHADHVLYLVDLQAKTLRTVGPFNAPKVPVGANMLEDTITDLAVAPDNTIYAVSAAALYTVDPGDGHVTKVGSLTACGTKTVALSTTPDGALWAGDFQGAVCRIDLATTPPTVKPPIKLQGGYALTGDLVAVADGTVFGTAYKLADGANMGSQLDNLLVKLDLNSGAVTPVGATGFPKLYGTSSANGQIFGFTHDGTGRVITIDPHTGAGTVYGTFSDPTTTKAISFAGAGVNPMVQIIN
jgi:streptogramin lyase